MKNRIHLIGFGSQGSAWAENLRDSGWDVRVYLGRREGGWARATELKFAPRMIGELAGDLQVGDGVRLVAGLCPDSLIGPLYRDFPARAEVPLTLVLAHGYAVYAGDLKMAQAGHEIALVAPKAIGPQLRRAFVESRLHSLKAGFAAPEGRRAQILELAAALGFREGNLIVTTPEMEAIGDLISEQGLLIGGVFTLLEWTAEGMRSAGVPDELIREECLTELELIAGLIRTRGPGATFDLISQAAKAGAVEMHGVLSSAGVREVLQERFEKVLNREFVEEFKRGEWKAGALEFKKRLEKWDLK